MQWALSLNFAKKEFMDRRGLIARIIALLTIPGSWLARLREVWAGIRSSGPQNDMMGHTMTGMDMRGMMSRDNMMEPMRLGMELFERHAEISRTTQYLRDGIIDTTVSSNPKTAQHEGQGMEQNNCETRLRPAGHRQAPTRMEYSVTAANGDGIPEMTRLRLACMGPIQKVIW